MACQKELKSAPLPPSIYSPPVPSITDSVPPSPLPPLLDLANAPPMASEKDVSKAATTPSKSPAPKIEISPKRSNRVVMGPRRKVVIDELFESEKVYVNQLAIALEVFMVPMRQATCVDKAWVPQIFRNIELIHSVNSTLYVGVL
jgi:RhoGEF domain